MLHHDKDFLRDIERDVVEEIKKYFSSNLVSIFVEGSFANDDYIKGYSDYDVLVIIKKDDESKGFNLDKLSKKYRIEIQADVKLYKDFLNRIKNNNLATRFVGNLTLLELKNKNRLIFGKDLCKNIPSKNKLIKRDLTTELRDLFLFATNPDKRWNIFIREPRKWCNYIINMANALLLSSGVFVNKTKLLDSIKKYHPKFKGVRELERAIKLRETGKILTLSFKEARLLKKDLERFLESFRDYLF